MVMQTEQIKNLIKVLQDTLQTSTNFWENNSKSHAFIIGYLEGTIKGTISVLEERIK